MELDPNGDVAAPKGHELDRRLLVPLGADAAAVLRGMPVGVFGLVLMAVRGDGGRRCWFMLLTF